MIQSLMTRLLLLAIFAFNAVLAIAQGSATAPKIASIAGAVVKEPGSEPLKKVLVQVIAEDQKQGGNYTASTDADGHFRVENVVPGRYRIFVERTGFVGVNERGLKSETNVFTLQAGQSLEDLLFRMLPTAVIDGRITDEDGDPMSSVGVFAQKKIAGKGTRESVASGTTNDLGEYRLAGLFPGQYWIVAMPPPDFRDYERPREKSPPDNKDNKNDNNGSQPDTRYLTTYYPGTNDAMQASTVTLKAGDEMPVNLTLVPARTYRIRGIVTGVPSGVKPSVELFSKAGDSIRANAGEIGPDGQFEIRGVAPGSYVLKLMAHTEAVSLSAHQDVTVVAGDVDGAKLVPQPSFPLSGHFRIEGGAPGDLTRYAVNLRQAELPEDAGFFISQDFFGTNAPIDRLGNFTWKDVNPGNYVVQVVGGEAQGFYLKSATLGGRDIATGFAASGPATLDLVVSTKGGVVEGNVTEKKRDGDTDSLNNDHPVANATVVAVPEEKYRKLPDRFGVGSTDQGGRFTIRGLAPGGYTLYAWQDLEDGVWRDADFLKSQEATGTAVKVEEGSDQRVELRLIVLSEEWR
ncbi:MAG: carboxypeptidase regulatory-like domain-containing protein [Terriglobales bacterium]